jgi:hypothetical protein
MVAVISASGVHHNAELLDLSRTGARLKGRSFPDEGEELTFRAEKVSAAGIVVWLDGEHCGLAFDTPIAAAEVQRIRAFANFVEGVAGKTAGKHGPS